MPPFCIPGTNNFLQFTKNSHDFDKIYLWKKNKTFHVWWQLCIIYVLAAYKICHNRKFREVCLFYNVRFERFFIFVEKMQNFRKFSYRYFYSNLYFNLQPFPKLGKCQVDIDLFFLLILHMEIMQNVRNSDDQF